MEVVFDVEIESAYALAVLFTRINDAECEDNFFEFLSVAHTVDIFDTCIVNLDCEVAVREYIYDIEE